MSRKINSPSLAQPSERAGAQKEFLSQPTRRQGSSSSFRAGNKPSTFANDYSAEQQINKRINK